MKNFIQSSRLFALLPLGLAGLAVVTLWQGAGDEGENKEAPSTNRHGTHTESGQIPDNPRSARRLQSHSNHTTTHSGNASATATETRSGTSQPSVVKRHKGGDRDILHRAKSSRRVNPGNHKRETTSIHSILSHAALTTRQRVDALEDLRSSGRLNDEDLAAANDYLAAATPPEGTSPGQHHWMVDELITTLRADGADNAALSRTLADLYQNKSQHMVVRDYALQHLGHLQSEGGDSAVIAKTLRTATTEKQGTLAGTALLALQGSVGVPPASSQALAIASDASYDIRSRITAMQVAGKQGNIEALPFAIEVATSNTQPVSLRMAAIATLGDLKAIDQQPFLQTLTQSRDTRLRTAATAAIKKLTTESK